MRLISSFIALLSLSGLANAADGLFEEPAANLQVSYPDRGEYSRHIVAIGVPEGLTPVAVVTTKDLIGRCKIEEAPMYKVPDAEVTSELCATVGADVIAGEVTGCATADGQVEEVWMYDVRGLRFQTNFNVLLRDGAEVVDQSGWFPSEAYANGCERPSYEP